jgi:hypothetical protein
MNLSGKKLTTAILAGLMGATMFGGSVFAEVSDQEFNEVRQGVNSNTQRISQLESAQKDAKDYSKDIAANKTAISDETKARQDADTKLQGSVDANKTAIDNETKARQDADTKLQGSVDANKTAIDNETKARQDADTKLQGSVDANKTAIDNETKARQDADTKLQGSVDANKTAIDNETKARQDADTKLQGSVDANAKAIDAEVTARDQAVAQERAERKGADAAQDKVIQQVNQNVANGFDTLNKNIGTITNQLNQNDLAEQQTRAAADKTLQDNIDAEATARDAADQTLQKNITDIQNTLKDASALASADATKSATQAASDATKAADKANKVADGLKERVDLISHQHDITSESDLIKKDQTIGQNLTNVDTALHKEIAARIGADAAQDKVIEQVNKNVADGFNTINQNMAAGFTALNQADANEATTRDAADQKLQGNIDAEATARDQAVAQERAERKGADAAQDKVIKQVNDNLVSSVNTINKNVADGFNALSAVDLQEAQTRAAEDQKEAQTRAAEDQKEAQTRAAADQNLQNQINNNSTSINDLYGRYSSLKTDINKVGARSAALAGLHPLDFDPANKLNFAVASGSFKGENSVALGAFYRPNENIMFSAASTMGDSDNAYTFGLSFKIGPSSAKTKTTSPDAEELYKVVGELQNQLAAQQKEIEQLKADKAK